MYKLLIRNVSVVCVVRNGEPYVCGAAMDRVAVIPGGSVVVGDDGRITHVGTAEEVEAATAGCTFETVIDGTNKSLIPGLIDAHTHPVWTGDRCHEFILKLNGASYMEVQKAGGGIGFTTRCTAEASEEELEQLLLKRLDRMLRFGTTLIEGKSGYGMEVATEMKMLRVLHSAAQKHPIEIVSTFLGAHAVPKGKTADAIVHDVIHVMLPELVRQRDAGLVSPEFIDVFCESDNFDRDQTREMLVAGAKAGLKGNFHGDELSCTHSGELAGELGAAAVSHLEHITPEGIAAMAEKKSFAVLLPTTAYVLRITPPPARRIIDGGVPVALGSDFCPNAHSVSMPHTMNLACVMMRMTVNEALVAATINAAGAVGRSATHGSIEVGKVGDFVLVDAPRWEHLIYQMVDPPIAAVIKRGSICKF